MAIRKKISWRRSPTIERATADEVRARLDFQRYQALAEKYLVSKQQRQLEVGTAQQQNYQHKLDVW